jgi:glutamyl-tRNA reductase
VARTVLIVGGSGAFGSRLAAGLIATTDFDVLIAGRDLARAEALATTFGPRARGRGSKAQTGGTRST